jgi:sarcosine oxidase subunit beta
MQPKRAQPSPGQRSTTAASSQETTGGLPITVDVVIIGAGIIGASCAFHLADRGLRVAVVEAMEAPAQGSTGRSFSSIRAQWADPLNVEMSWRSLQIYRNFQSEHGIDVGYRPTGYLFLLPSESWHDYQDTIAMQRSYGVPVTILDLKAAQRITPFDESGLGGATLGEADGVVDAHLMTSAFLQGARERGSSVHLHQPVTSVRVEADRWIVQSARATFHATYVVNAAGGWAGEVAALAGLDVPVQHYRRNIYASAAGAVAARYPMTVDLGSGAYLRSEGDRILFSVARPDEVSGYNTRVDWPWMESVLQIATQRFGWLADLPIDRKACWAGTYEMTPDSQPILGAHPDSRGWVNACGMSGRGVMQAPEVGHLIAEEIVDGGAHSIDITPLRIERFQSTSAPSTRLVF